MGCKLHVLDGSRRFDSRNDSRVMSRTVPSPGRHLLCLRLRQRVEMSCMNQEYCNSTCKATCVRRRGEGGQTCKPKPDFIMEEKIGQTHLHSLSTTSTRRVGRTQMGGGGVVNHRSGSSSGAGSSGGGSSSSLFPGKLTPVLNQASFSIARLAVCRTFTAGPA